jgi:integrase
MAKRKLPRGIRLRGDRYFVDVTWKGLRSTATCATLEEAVAKQAELRHALMTGAAPAKEGAAWTVGQAWERTFNIAWKGGRSERAMLIMKGAIMSYWGEGTLLSSIDTDALDAWCETLERAGNSNATINRKLAALSKMMTIAYDRGGLRAKPKFPRRKEPVGRIRFITETEERQIITLLQQYGKHDALDAIIVLLDTGMRCGELWNLEGRDVDLRQGVLAIWQTKADLPRSVPMTQRVRGIIETRMRQGKGKLFPFDNWWLRPIWQRLKMAMGLENDDQFVPHVLRHTCASRLVQRGVPIPVVQAWLGHKTISITMRYAHLAPKNLLDAVHVLEQQTTSTSRPVLRVVVAGEGDVAAGMVELVDTQVSKTCAPQGFAGSTPAPGTT